MRTIRGSGCVLTWSDDGTTVTKRYDRLRHSYAAAGLASGWRPFPVERRVGALLTRQPPPVEHARLLAADHGTRSLVFEAIDGEPMGPKFALSLAAADVADLVGLALDLGRYRPHAPFLRRFDLSRRIASAVDAGTIGPSEADSLRRQCVDDPPTFVFGHGDITARNVIRAADGRAVLIDWEWAGWYPAGWDLAFLWFSLKDQPGGRAAVEAAVPPALEAWFWRSALLVQVLHLGMWGFRGGTPFRAAHESTRDELVARVLSLL